VYKLFAEDIFAELIFADLAKLSPQNFENQSSAKISSTKLDFLMSANLKYSFILTTRSGQHPQKLFEIF